MGMAPSTEYWSKSLSQGEVNFSDQRRQAEVSECRLLQHLPEITSSEACFSGKQGLKQPVPPNVGIWCPASTHFEMRRVGALGRLSSNLLKSRPEAKRAITTLLGDRCLCWCLPQKFLVIP